MLGHEFYLVSNMNYLLFLNHKKSNENHVIFRCLDSFGQIHYVLVLQELLQLKKSLNVEVEQLRSVSILH